MSVFIFPAGIIFELEALFRDFLWASGDSAKGKCKVAWDDVCKPEKFGGLGFKRLDMWNRCLVTKQIWDIVSSRDSLWVRWVRTHYLKNENFWLIRKRDWWSWIFRSILKIRPLVRPFFFNQIGDGLSTNAWEDKWLQIGHLSALISYRNIHNLGFSASDSVRDFLSNAGFVWPVEMLALVPPLGSMMVPQLTDSLDSVGWLGRNSMILSFSIREAWKSMQPYMDERQWTKMIWNKAYIPKHAVCVWLACRKRLTTQDRVLIWKHDPPDMKCLLCHQCLETHDHLFFQCSYSQVCLDLINKEVQLDNIPSTWEVTLERFEEGRFNHWSTLQKLSFSALIYFIWRERNRRLYENHLKNPDDLFKEAREVILARMAWKMKTKQLSSVNGRS